MPSIFRSSRTLSRVRLLSIASAVACVVAFVCCREHDRGVQLATGPFISCGDACLKVGLRRTSAAGVFAIDSWRNDFTYAWRPFRVAPSFAAGSPNYLAVPLWPALLLSLPLAGWAHGRLYGLTLRPHACRTCGYDLSGGRAESGVRTCPECGERHPAPPSA